VPESIAARVETEVTRRTQELASLVEFLQMTVEREKAALARELHDELGGILTPAKMDLAWLQGRLGEHPEFGERMRRIAALIDQGIDLKRRLIEDLRPSLLDHLGLVSALRWFVEESCKSASLEAHVHVSDALGRLPPDLEITLFRLVQEGVSNIVRHAHAKRIDLTLERTARGLRVTLSDDGVGIADLEAARRLSHGLASMRQRMRSMQGTFELKSLAGEGTRIEVFVPLAAAAGDTRAQSARGS